MKYCPACQHEMTQECDGFGSAPPHDVCIVCAKRQFVQRGIELGLSEVKMAIRRASLERAEKDFPKK